MAVLKFTITFFLLSLAAAAQTLPDAPIAKPKGHMATLTLKTFADHHAADRLNKISLWASIAARAGDTAVSCYNLNSGPTAREYWLPVSTCRGVAAWNAGTVAAAWAGGKLLHRWGLHRLESAPNWVSFAGSAAGLGYSLAHPPR